MAGERDGQLVGEDVVLGFEVRGEEREDVGERRGGVGFVPAARILAVGSGGGKDGVGG